MNLKHELTIFADALKVLSVQSEENNVMNMLDGIFEQYDVTTSGFEMQEMYQMSEHDIVICDLDCKSVDMIDEIAGLKMLNKSVHIVATSSEATQEQLISLINQGIDGYIPKPITEETLFERLIKVSESAYYDKYFTDEPDEDSSKKKMQHDADPSVVKLNSVQEETIRHSVHDKMNASTFVETLTPEEFEKVADFNDELDNFYVSVLAIKELNHKEQIAGFPYLASYFNNFYTIVNNIYRFPIISNAFYSFSDFLYSIKPEELDDREKVDEFIDSMLGIIGDFQAWIDSIFIKQTTDNVNYMDASFASSCVEIESMFRGQSIDTEDDSLEFF